MRNFKMNNKIIISKELLNQIILEELENILLEKKAEIIFKKNKKQLEEIIKKYDKKILKEQEQYTKELDVLQLILDILGIFPGAGEAANATNAFISFQRGNYIAAALDLVAMVPAVGDVIAIPIKSLLKAKKAIPPKLVKELVENLPKITNFLTTNIPKILSKIPKIINKVPGLGKERKILVIKTIGEMSSKHLPKILNSLNIFAKKLTAGGAEDIVAKNLAKRTLSTQKRDRRRQIFFGGEQQQG